MLTAGAKRMGTPIRTERICKSLAVILIAIVAIALFPSPATSQRSSKKLSKDDIVNLLTGDVPSDEVAQEARKAGISFQVTPAAEKDIRAVGGTDDLIRVLRSLSPGGSTNPPAPINPPQVTPSSAPPVLMIESNPGQSEVYVDDEPVGTTSQAGRLKLTRVAPGSHRVRVSLSGYQDYEQAVTLTGGGTTSVSASLQRVQVAQITPPPQTQVPVQPPPQVQPPVQVPPPQVQRPSLSPAAQSFIVAHDHGQGGQQYCVGIMTVGNGMISYKGLKSTFGVPHSFDIPLNTVRRAGRNGVYLIAYMAFHIQTKRGANFNFAVLDQQGHFQPPDAILNAIDAAMGK